MGRKNKTNKELRNKTSYEDSRELESDGNQTDKIDDGVRNAEHAVTSVDVLVKAGTEFFMPICQTKKFIFNTFVGMFSLVVIIWVSPL